MFKPLLAAAVLAATSVAASAATNLVVDGSFESLVVNPGSYDTVAAMTGWTSTNGIEVRDNVVGSAQNDANFVELDTNANSSISQTLATVAGQEYKLSFYVEDRPDISIAAAGVTDGLSFGVTNATGQTSAVIAGGTDAGWTLYTYDFVASGTSSVLSFAAGGTSDSYGSSLDNVAVTAVPEPASIGMLAAGLVLLGVSRRRSRR